MRPGRLGHALLWGLGGLVVSPLIVLLISRVLRVSPACGVDALGCTTDVASLMILFAAPGAALVFIAAFQSGLGDVARGNGDEKRVTLLPRERGKVAWRIHDG